MFKGAFSDFSLSATNSELSSQVFRTGGVTISGGCINNSSTTVIAKTGAGGGYYTTDKGSFAATFSFKAGQTTGGSLGAIGLTVDPAPNSYVNMSFSWVISDTPDVLIRENGVAIAGTTNTYTTDTVFKIEYRNNTISYYLDDVLIRETGPIYSYLYAGGTLDLSSPNVSATDISYRRYNLVNSQPAPLTITFQPSSINFEDQFVSKMVYAMPDRVVTRNFTFSTLQDALTGSTKDIDSRSNYSYTFYNAPSGDVSHIVTLSATLFPSLSTLEYKIEVPVERPRLTRNPSLTSTDSFVFDSAHLLKSRAWGPNNTVMFVVEGINRDNTSQLFLLSSTQ